MAEAYVHSYAQGEQDRLLARAEHWRDDVRTTLPPGTRAARGGCGVGAVLGILGEAFPGLTLAGVDLEARQIEMARDHVCQRGIAAELRCADGLELPYDDASFDHVWMMWFLEHVPDAVGALREARRVLVPRRRSSTAGARSTGAASRGSTPTPASRRYWVSASTAVGSSPPRMGARRGAGIDCSVLLCYGS
jgi:ubiquinone/menaquinone biosynthesis C-methylase UbiE